MVSNKTLFKIKLATADNEHTEALLILAVAMKEKDLANILRHIKKIHDIEGHMPAELGQYREYIWKQLEMEILERWGKKALAVINHCF